MPSSPLAVNGVTKSTPRSYTSIPTSRPAIDPQSETEQRNLKKELEDEQVLYPLYPLRNAEKSCHLPCLAPAAPSSQVHNPAAGFCRHFHCCKSRSSTHPSCHFHYIRSCRLSTRVYLECCSARFCLSKVRILKRSRDPSPFLRPIDIVGLNIPHYYGLPIHY